MSLQQRGRQVLALPPLPEGFVPRAEVTGAIVDALLATEKKPLAIYGAGGFGKTTLAIAVSHESEVVRAFSDGLVWITLGEKHPDVEQKLGEICAVFTGKRPAETTLVGIAAEIKKELAGKIWLIVVDDVWEDSDLIPFEGLGARRLMFTTRKRELANSRDAIEVQEMSFDESFKLLTRGMPISGRPQSAMSQFATSLGGWPLLLELANGRLLTEIQAGHSFASALAYVIELYRQRGVIGFDYKDTEQRNKAVSNCLEAGLEAYKLKIPNLRARAAELGIFPARVAIPTHVLCEFWDCEEVSLIEDTLRHLDNLSIVKWDRRAKEVRLHSSVRAALIAWVPNRRFSHRRLLKAWGNPVRLPHDYSWRWYGWHCLKAGYLKKLRQLLLSPEWLQAKLDHTDIGALVVECERVMQPRTRDRLEDQHRVHRNRQRLGKPSDPTITLLSDALKKSVHVLASDKRQLCDQLYGRLRLTMGAELRKLCSELRVFPCRQRLRARFANLEPAGSPLLRTLTGHENGARGALLLPGGKRILSWSNDGTLRLWHLETGQQLGRPFTGHQDGVNGALLLSNGKQFLSWSDDRTMRLWDIETGQQLGNPISGHEDGVEGALLLPGGEQVLSWSSDRTLRIWDLRSHLQLGDSLVGHEDSVEGVMLLPGGKQALSWSNDTTLRLWDLEKFGTVRSPFTGHEGWVDGALLLPRGDQVLSWSRDRTLRLWELRTGRQIGKPFVGHLEAGLGAQLLPNGEQFLSWSHDRTLRLWDLKTRMRIGEPFIGHKDGGLGALLLPEGKQALSWSEDRTLRLWDLDTHQQIGESLTWHENEVLGALLLPSGKEAVSWSWDGTLRLWDLERAQHVSRPFTGHQDGGVKALLLPSRKQILSWSRDRTLRLWSVDSGRQTTNPLVGHEKEILGALILPSGKRALSWSWDRTLRLWDLRTGRQVGKPFVGHEKEVLGALLLDSKSALSWSSDTSLRFWNLQTGQEGGQPLVGHELEVVGALFVLNRTRVLSWSRDGTLRLWNLRAHQQVGKPMVGHKDEIMGVTLLPDEKQALSWSRDRTLRLWNLQAGLQVGNPFIGHEKEVLGALLLDSEYALSWSSDLSLRLWNLRTGQQVGKPFIGHEQEILGASLLPGGRQVVSWSNDTTLRLWDLIAGHQHNAPLGSHSSWAEGVMPLPEELLLSWSDDRTVRLWDLTRRTEISAFYGEGTIDVLVDIGKNRFFAGDGTGRVHFLELVGSPFRRNHLQKKESKSGHATSPKSAKATMREAKESLPPIGSGRLGGFIMTIGIPTSSQYQILEWITPCYPNSMTKTAGC
jgi:WD40 repeat protein